MVLNVANCMNNSEDVELKRALARRNRDETRLKKLHNARLRNSGADIVGISEQIQHKKEKQNQEKEAEMNDVNDQQQLRRYVERIELDEYNKKQLEKAQLRNDWKHQSLSRTQRREADIAEPVISSKPIDVEMCGVSAVQSLKGEDLYAEERKKLQAAQIRSWNDAIANQKHQEKHKKKQEDQDYCNFISNINKHQEKIEESMKEKEVANAIENLRINQQISMSRMARNNMSRQQELESEQSHVSNVINSSILSENREQGKSVQPGRVRVDHWKGMDQERVSDILHTNENLLREKELKRQKEKEQLEKELQEQTNINKYVHEIEYQEYQKKLRKNQELKQTLDQQVLEAKKREEQQKKASQGKIEQGFFQSFGTSYR